MFHRLPFRKISRESTADAFFRKTVEELSGGAEAKESKVKRALRRFVKVIDFTLRTWIYTRAIFEVLAIVPVLQVQPMPHVPGHFLRPFSFSNEPSRCITALESRIITIESRMVAIESRLEFLEQPAQHPQISLRNFAAKGDGAKPIKAFTTSNHVGSRDGFFQYFGFKTKSKSALMPPVVALDDNAGVGSCWELMGSKGRLGIQLSEPVYIAQLSINHVHPNLTSSASAGKAPKELALWGLYPQSISLPSDIQTRQPSHFLTSHSLPHNVAATDHFVLLTNGTYDPSFAATRQYFDVPDSLLFSLSSPSPIVVLELLNNWGSNTTCLYNVGIHEGVVH